MPGEFTPQDPEITRQLKYNEDIAYGITKITDLIAEDKTNAEFGNAILQLDNDSLHRLDYTLNNKGLNGLVDFFDVITGNGKKEEAIRSIGIITQETNREKLEALTEELVNLAK